MKNLKIKNKAVSNDQKKSKFEIEDLKIESYFTEISDDKLRNVRGGTGDEWGTSYNSCVIKCNTGSDCYPH